jgi:hypothetical protein
LFNENPDEDGFLLNHESVQSIVDGIDLILMASSNAAPHAFVIPFRFCIPVKKPDWENLTLLTR